MISLHKNPNCDDEKLNTKKKCLKTLIMHTGITLLVQRAKYRMQMHFVLHLHSSPLTQERIGC